MSVYCRTISGAEARLNTFRTEQAVRDHVATERASDADKEVWLPGQSTSGPVIKGNRPNVEVNYDHIDLLWVEADD